MLILLALVVCLLALTQSLLALRESLLALDSSLLALNQFCLQVVTLDLLNKMTNSTKQLLQRCSI